MKNIRMTAVALTLCVMTYGCSGHRHVSLLVIEPDGAPAPNVRAQCPLTDEKEILLPEVKTDAGGFARVECKVQTGGYTRINIQHNGVTHRCQLNVNHQGSAVIYILNKGFIVGISPSDADRIELLSQ